MEEKFLLFYHKEDNDGVCSAALIYNYLIKELHANPESIELRGLDYNDIASYKRKDLKELREKFSNLVLTDISFPVPLMEYMWKLWGTSMHWFDHHAPVIAAMSNSEKIGNLLEMPGKRDSSCSAILCVYKYLYDPIASKNNAKIPQLLRALSAWDSFSYEKEGFELDYVKNVNDGFTDMCELNVMKASEMLQDFDDLFRYEKQAYEIGRILNEHEKQVFAKLIPQSGNCNWKVVEDDGTEHTACCIAYGGKTNSLMFEAVKGKVECGIVMKMNANKTWTISLYNVDNENKSFHCGKFMREKYKGGGHQGAAGAQVKQTRALDIIRKQKI